MKRIFKTRHFGRWARKRNVPDESLFQAIVEIEQGLVDAVLAAGLVKKRVSAAGRGKRGGARVILAGKMGNRWFFLHGFMKNERENITSNELEGLINLAENLMTLSTTQIDEALRDGALMEVRNEKSKKG